MNIMFMGRIRALRGAPERVRQGRLLPRSSAGPAAGYVGLSVDYASGTPVGLTVMPGNVTHFKETFKQIRSLLPDDAMIVFDNGAYSMENSALLDKEGFGFVTRCR